MAAAIGLRGRILRRKKSRQRYQNRLPAGHRAKLHPVNRAGDNRR